MKYLVLFLVLMGALRCDAGEIVVLTATPVAEFALPDGSVLANAYVWRRSSQGLMIMHDGGHYFLNFKLLPEDWKAVYLPPSNQSDDPEVVVQPIEDRYEAASLLGEVPDLDVAAHALLFSIDGSEIKKQKILMIGALHSLLTGNFDEAKRFLLTIEEQGYKLEEVERKKLFRSCANCGGDGRVEKTCKICKGTGECPDCEGKGTKSGEFNKVTMQCTTCRGKGVCPGCKGKKKFSIVCSKCKGAGKILNRSYCEILRDRIVREVNAMATPDRWIAVTSSSTLQIDTVLAKIAELDESARAFYCSDKYKGEMDTNLVVACFMYSLANENFKEAEHFNQMVGMLFPDGDVLDVEKYLKRCKKCDATGWIERDCQSCEGSGECSRCEGSGKRDQALGKDGKSHCTTCRGTGECVVCQGKGVVRVKCKSCKGEGRILDRQRAEIKLGLLVDRLNEFYNKR